MKFKLLTFSLTDKDVFNINLLIFEIRAPNHLTSSAELVTGMGKKFQFLCKVLSSILCCIRPNQSFSSETTFLTRNQ